MTTALHSPPGIVPGLARAWVRTYSAGMREEARAVRLIEIESDLWEHFADRTADGAAPAAVGLEAFSRLVRGVPSDIAWRFQAEGFHMNIHIPLERLAGLLLLFLIVPFMAGVSISGYDTTRSVWPDEFNRFADIPSWQRNWTAILHAAVGLGLIGAASQLLASFRERSPRLVTAGCLLLAVAGTTMLVNAAAYRAMSALADDYLASGDRALISTARGHAIVVESLAGANLATSTIGILCLGVAFVRLALLPRWTVALPAAGVAAPFIWVALDPVFDDMAWVAMAIGMLSVMLWLLICGAWLLFGGSTQLRSMKGIPAHTG
jgi:hypothetical protein